MERRNQPKPCPRMIDNIKPPPPRRKRQSVTNTLVVALSRQITEEVIKCGEKLPTESEIMSAHNVSRTVVAERS